MATILCVDDSQAIRSMIRLVLEQHGHEVLIAEDGVEALELARSQAVDLVLSDVNMPNMSGSGLVSKLRRLADYANTPIVMVTTESDGYKKDKLKSLGANGWLKKPFSEQQLTNVLNHFLK
ncbi:MAG: response regulator [Gammaproteobacteria bacterium]|nr:response regulator [Gammaproteobacteria bacterium]